jgi:hypothetical protein
VLIAGFAIQVSKLLQKNTKAIRNGPHFADAAKTFVKQ